MPVSQSAWKYNFIKGEKMSLPQRLYYPLYKAAKLLGCDVDDLIHFAANRKTRLCIRLELSSSDLILDKGCAPNFLINEKELLLNVKKDYPEIDCEKNDTASYDGVIDFNYATAYSNVCGKVDYDAIYTNDKLEMRNYSVYLFLISGLFEVSVHDLYLNEERLINNEIVTSKTFNFPVDDSVSEIDGYYDVYNDYVKDLLHSSIIDKDSEEFKMEGLENRLCMEIDPVEFSLSNLYITKYELDKLKNHSSNKISDRKVNHNDRLLGNPKSAAKIEEFITCILGLIPEFKGVNIDELTTQRIKLMLESISAERGVPFNQIHPQTIGKYLGR